MVGEQAQAGGDLRDRAVIRPDKENHLTGSSTQALGIARRDTIQRGRDRTHGVAGKQETEQAGKVAETTLHFADHGHALLQGPAEDLPELAVFAGQFWLPPL